MSSKKKHSIFLRMTAILLALFMLSGDPVRVLAAEFGEVDTDFDQEFEVFDDDDYEFDEDYEGEEDVPDDSEDEFLEEDYSDEEEDEDELTLEQVQSLVDGLDSDVIEGDGEVELPTEDETEIALKALQEKGFVGVPAYGETPIAETEYTIKRFADHVSVTNNAKGNTDADYLYAALVYADVSAAGNLYVLGTEIAPGKSADLAVAYDSAKNKDFVNQTSDYVLWLGRSDYYEDDETSEIGYYRFKILGYTPVYTEEGEIETDEHDNPKYTKADMIEVNLPSTDPISEYDGTWKDGYTGIKMKAVVQKNLTSVKISWAPDTKNKPEQKEYKQYKLYHLTPDASEPTGYKAKELWGPKKGKSVTLKKVDTEKDSLIYRLDCLDAAGAVKDSFVTCAAPYFLQIQSGDITGDFDFTMIKRADVNQVYMLEIASKNKEYDAAKAPDGFQEAWTTAYPVEEGFNEEHCEGDFLISKTQMPQCVKLSYTLDEPSCTLGNKYFGRIQVATFVNGLRVVSAPSNVRSCKAGPNSCFIMATAGVYYDATDAKNGNAKNLERANKHINDYINGENIDPASEIYVHDTNTEVCAKDGLIYFVTDKDISNIKSFELLKCNAVNGTYKKVKNYPLGSAALMECTLENENFSTIRMFAMFYNNFVPEKMTYYAVRPIATKKNTPGGWSTGELIVPEMNVVQGLVTSDSGPNMIQLAWLADDCVKQYWLYRGTKSINGAERKSAGQTGDELIAKIGIKKAKKYQLQLSDEDENNTKTVKVISYKDTKNLKIDTNYYYYVRPIYDVATAKKDNTIYIPYISDEVRGKASALYTQIVNFKAANEALEQIRVSFKQVKNIKYYRVFRLEVDSSTKKLTNDMKPDLTEIYEEFSDKYKTYEEFEEYIASISEDEWKAIITKAGYDGYNWKYVRTITTNGNSEANKAFIDSTVDIGSYYFYLIQGASDGSSSINFAYTGRVRNVPLPVTNVSASYSEPGIRLSYKLNSKDEGHSHLTVQVSTNGGDSWTNAGKNAYHDTNVRRGEERNYKIRVKYSHNGVTCYSSEVSYKYSLPTGIEVTKASDTGEFKDNVYTIKKGETGKLAYRAYLSNGSTAAYNVISRSNTPDGNNVISIQSSTSNSFEFKANEVGTVSYNLYCAGITRQITIKVVK